MDINSFREVIDELCCGFQPESSYWVNVTEITNPHNFHVRPCNFDHHLARLESYIQDCNECIGQPSIHQLVVFQSTTEALRIVRGQIVAIKDSELSQTCNIYAFDYGFVDEKIALNQIFKCEDEIFKLPPLSIRCHLHMCSAIGGEWSDDSIEAFRYYLGEDSVKIIVKHKLNTKLIVVIINTNPDDLATMMAITGYATLGYVDPLASKDSSASTSLIEPKAPQRLYYEFKERHVNDTLHVRMLSGQKLSGFYVAEVSEYYKYLALKDDINLYATRERELKVDEMTIGRPVLMHEEIKLRGSQRAVIEVVSPCASEATLCFVDNGKRLVVKKKNIKVIVEELLIPPPLAIYCSAEKLPSEIKSQEFFLPGFEFMITIDELGSELKSPNVVTIQQSN